MDRDPPPPPIDSATLVLLREDDHTGLQVLLVRRHAESRAFAGAHVFPGGCVDPGDSSPVLQEASRGLTPEAAAQRLADATPPAAALSFWVAAIRELFEETGVLLASSAAAPLDPTDIACSARFETHREAMLTAGMTFEDLVRSEGLSLTTHELEYFARWITPANAPRRYDARFFVARLPPGQQPLHDRREITATEWFAPAAAIARAQAGAIVLAPPTLRTLEELRELGSIEKVVRAARQRDTTPITPKFVTVAGCPTILYPGDADYPRAVPGESMTESCAGPRDRLVMEGAGWRTLRSGLD